MIVPALDLFLHDRFVGTVEADSRDRSRVALSVDTGYEDGGIVPDWPTDPKRATAGRFAELLGSIPGGDAAVEQWLRQLTFHVAIGNNDAHAKNVALMHLASGTELSQVYDALPSLFQQGLIKWDLALAIDGVSDHRRMSVERILAEARSWAVISDGRASAAVMETLDALNMAVDVVTLPSGASVGMTERIRWSLGRLISGAEISQPKR